MTDTGDDVGAVGQVRVLLDKLNSAPDLAQFLLDEGVQGRPRSATLCVVAEYFNQRLDHPYFVSVGDDIHLHRRGQEGDVERFPTTEAHKEFVRLFDMRTPLVVTHSDNLGPYPELVRWRDK